MQQKKEQGIFREKRRPANVLVGWMFGSWVLSLIGWVVLCGLCNGKKIWIVQTLGALLITFLFMFLENHFYDLLPRHERERHGPDDSDL